MARLPKPWYRADRDAWFVTIRGVRHKLAKDKKKAFEKYFALMQAPAEPAKSVDPTLLVSIADEFLDWVKNNRSDDTYEWYRYRLQRFCDAHPNIEMLDVKPYHVQKWIDSYPDFTPTSKRNYIRSVKRCFSWAVEQGYIDKSPIAALGAPSASRKEVVLGQDDFDHMLANVPDPQLRSLCQVTYAVGCRPQELLRVEARHFDAANSRWVLPIIEAKGKREPRIIYLTPDAEALTQQLVKQFPTGRLFRNSQGNPWTVSAVNCAFKRLQHRMGKAEMKRRGIELSVALQAEIDLDPELKSKTINQLNRDEKRKLTNRACTRYAPKYCLYALRHSWATRALQAGVDPLTVAVLMGHSDPSQLSKTYQHLSLNPKHMLDQARKATATS